jgi:integrase
MRGDGFIRQEKTGHRAYITIAGKRRAKSFPSARKAEDWLASERKKKHRAAAGLPVDLTPARAITVKALADRLVEHWEAGTDRVYTAATLRGYKWELARLVEYWGPRPVARIRKADVSAWVKTMRDAGLSTSSIRKQLDRLSQLFQLAEEQEHVAAPPCKVKRPRLVQRSEPEAVSEAEYSRLIEAARASADPRRLVVILLAGDAGLRRGEILRLRWEDLTLGPVEGLSPHGAIHVAVRDETDRPKSGRARTVPILTERLARALEGVSWPGRVGQIVAGIGTVEGLQYMAERVWADARRAATPALRPVEPTGEPGRPRETSRLHGLRHRFGTWCAEAGVPTKVLRDWLGHSTVLTTERYFRRRGGAVDPALVARLGDSAERKQSTNSPPNAQNA